MRPAALVVGLLLTFLTFLAMIQSMLVPRRTRSLMVRTVNTLVVWFSRIPLRILHTYLAQDRWLARAAPLSVLLQLVFYVVIMILTLGLVMYGTTQLAVTDSLYQSGSTFTTLGIVTPVNDVSALVCFVAAFLGLVVIAVFIGYLMALYGSFIGRETGMARLAMLAGEPAWGPLILARGHILGLPESEVPAAKLWTDWICDVRLNHAVNPVLMYFRSTSSRRHWVTTMLAVLDAAALRISLFPDRIDPHHIELTTEGSLTLRSLAVDIRRIRRDDPAQEAALHNWAMERAIVGAIHADQPDEAPDSGIDRAEFDVALAMLTGVGAVPSEDPDRAWARFSSLRAIYFPHAQDLATALHAVRAPWSGTRTPAIPVLAPELPDGSTAT